LYREKEREAGDKLLVLRKQQRDGRGGAFLKNIYSPDKRGGARKSQRGSRKDGECWGFVAMALNILLLTTNGVKGVRKTGRKLDGKAKGRYTGDLGRASPSYITNG